VTDAIINVLQWINDTILGMASEGSGLTSSMSAYLPGLYDHVLTIMQDVVQPVAYTILALFFLLELHKASVKTDGMGGPANLGAEIIFRVIFKMVICKAVVDSVDLIMNAIYEVSTHVTVGIAGVLGSGSLDGGGIDIVALRPAVDALGFWAGLICLIICFLIFLISMVAVLFGNIIVTVRFIELYVYFAVSPIPIATFAHEEMSQIGKGFLKHFAAVCIQGTLVFLILSFFPVLYNSALFKDSTMDVFGALMGVLGYSIVLIMAVLAAGKWAKQICNAV